MVIILVNGTSINYAVHSFVRGTDDLGYIGGNHLCKGSAARF